MRTHLSVVKTIAVFGSASGVGSRRPVSGPQLAEETDEFEDGNERKACIRLWVPLLRYWHPELKTKRGLMESDIPDKRLEGPDTERGYRNLCLQVALESYRDNSAILNDGDPK
jgi:hypothetical protein